MIVYALITMLCIMAVIMLSYFLYESSKHSYFIKKRLSKVVATDGYVSPAVANRSHLTELLSKRTEMLIARFVPANIVKNLERKIRTASIPNFTLAQYVLLKVIIVGLLLIFVPLYSVLLGMKLNQGIFLILLFAGAFFPDLMLKSAIDKRHKTIIREMPNFIDLLRVCIEAGMDLESGLNKVVEKSKGLLRDEARQTTIEIRMGKPLAEALQDLSDRIYLDDFSAFITLVIQAHQMGISIANVLKSQAYQINLKYVQTLRAKAAKVPVMIIVPMVMFILPALLVVILGPAIIQIIDVF